MCHIVTLRQKHLIFAPSLHHEEPEDIILPLSAPARITSFSSDIHYPYSQSVTLPCSTVGHPPPRLTWLVNNKLVHDNKNYQVLTDGSLLIVSMRESLSSVVCTVENVHGKDSISYSVTVVRPPVAPTIRVSKITTSSITLSWSPPHNGGALVQGAQIINIHSVCICEYFHKSIFPLQNECKWYVVKGPKFADLQSFYTNINLQVTYETSNKS